MKINKFQKPKAEEKVVETELAQELATEARQPISVVKQLQSELNGHDKVVTVPVVEAHEDSNPVLNEDHHVFAANSVVKSLGNLQDVASSLIDSVQVNAFQKPVVIEPQNEDEEENEDTKEVKNRPQPEDEDDVFSSSETPRSAS